MAKGAEVTEEERRIEWQNNVERDYPSLLPQNRMGVPHGWVQWKGTNVCMDIHCVCGYLSHIDAAFCYYLECPSCHQIYEVGGDVKLYPLTHRPEHTQVAEL